MVNLEFAFGFFKIKALIRKKYIGDFDGYPPALTAYDVITNGNVGANYTQLLS
jgi:hypothetical protein